MTLDEIYGVLEVGMYVMMGIFAHFRVLSGLPYEAESRPHVRICYISCLQNLNILLKLEFTGILFGTSLYFL